MDVTFINPFLAATRHTFSTMLSIDITAGTPIAQRQMKSVYDISGVIGLSGHAQGSIAISFPKKVALIIVSTLVGQSIKTVDQEVTDGIGEIANIIAGAAKKDLSRYNLSISLPNVVVGKDHVIAAQTGVPTLIVPLESAIGGFSLEVSLKTR
jgi:chemotaxis protein CheX